MSTPYAAIHSRSARLAALTDTNGDLAQLFVKVIHGLWTHYSKNGCNPARTRISVYTNKAGLIWALHSSGQKHYSRCFYTKRFTAYHEIVKLIPEIPGALDKIYRWSRDHRDYNAKLSRDNSRIIITGKEIVNA